MKFIFSLSYFEVEHDYKQQSSVEKGSTSIIIVYPL